MEENDRPIHHEIIRAMNSAVKQYFYEKARLELDGEGFDTDELAKDYTLRFYEKVGFVSLTLENGRAELLVLNPMEFIDNNSLWSFVWSKIDEKFGVTFSIGKFNLPEDTDFNTAFIYDYTTPEVKQSYD